MQLTTRGPGAIFRIGFLGLLVAPVGCDRNPEAPPPPKDAAAATASPRSPIRVRGAPGDPRPFTGLRGLLAAESSIHLFWDPAKSPDARYRIYVAESPGDQDFTRPLHTTGVGTHAHTIEGLTPGRTVYCVVRALDPSGEEDENRVEWRGTPGPIRYVDRTSREGGDGLTPTTAFRSIEQAVGSAIALESVNIYVAEGNYPERVFLFAGMMLWGGFAPSFARYDPISHRTTLASSTPDNLVVVAPGTGLCGLDGFVLDGAGRGDRGILAEDCEIQISHTEIRRFRSKAVQLRASEDEESRITGALLHCALSRNLGEGISIEGIADLAVRHCDIVENDQEGIEVESLMTPRGEKARLIVERCSVRRNHDIGLQLKLARFSDHVTGRLRVTCRDNVIEKNGDYGLSVDLQYLDAAEIDLKLKVERNRIAFNEKGGIYLDADARSSIHLAENLVVGNRGEGGLVITGESRPLVYAVRQSAFVGNARGGIRLLGPGSVIVRDCHFRANTGPALSRVHGWLAASGSIFEENREPSDIDRLSYSLLHQDAISSRVVGPGVQRGAPQLERQPRLLVRGDLRAPGRVTVAVAEHVAVGDSIEIDDDGVRRTVTERNDETLVFSPPVEGRPRTVWVAAWGESPSVTEEWTPRAQSPARGGGDPREAVAGTPPDLGPGAGSFPSGPANAESRDPRPIELAGVEPPPGSFVARTAWQLSFTDDLPREVSVRAMSGEQDLTARARRDDTGRAISIDVTDPPPPGSPVTLEIVPETVAGSGKSAWRLDFTTAALLPPPGTEVEDLPGVAVRTLAPGESHRYPITLAPGSTIRARLEPVARIDGLRWTWYRQDGEVRIELSRGSTPAGRLVLDSPAATHTERRLLEIENPAGKGPARYRLTLSP